MIPHNLPPTPDFEGHEYVVITLITPNKSMIKIAAFYLPPGVDHPLNTDVFENIFAGGLPTIIAGDLNSKHHAWGCRRANSRGDILLDYTVRNNIKIIAPNSPTYFPLNNFTPSTLDIAITKNINFNINAISVPKLSSDHNPVIFELHFLISSAKKTIKSINWSLFQENLQNKILGFNDINTSILLDEATNTLTNNIQESLSFSTTEKLAPVDPLALPSWIKRKIRHKNRLRKNYQNNMTSENKRLYNCAKNDVRDTVREYVSDRWKNLLYSATVQDNSIWKVYKIIKSNYTRIPTIHGRGGLAHTNEEKAEAFAEVYEEQFSPNPVINDSSNDPSDDEEPEFLDKINDYTRINPQQAIEPPATTTEINNIIKNLNIKKSSGPDEISNLMIKNLPHNVLKDLLLIINSSLKLQHFPNTWKQAAIKTIHKSGKDPVFPQNYRPISLLSNLGKILERVIITRLSTDIRDKQIIRNDQFGFLPGHSTTQQLLRVTEFLKINRARKRHCAGLFLDISKAFDKVWIHGLLFKMTQYHIKPELVRLIASYLSCRSFHVSIQDSRSSHRAITAGVPQGSILGPTLFLIYINDLPRPSSGITALYADDTAIILASKEISNAIVKLTQYIPLLEKWCARWRISVNADKSALVKFSRSRTTTANIHFQGTQVPNVNSTKYLGVIIDKNLSYKEHITHAINKAKKSMGILSKITRSSSLTITNKLLLYRQVIRPTLLYASPVWAYSGLANITRLQTFQNITLRRLTNSPWFVRNSIIHRDAQTPPIIDIIYDLATKFFEDAMNHENTEILQALNYQDPPPLKPTSRPYDFVNIKYREWMLKWGELRPP